MKKIFFILILISCISSNKVFAKDDFNRFGNYMISIGMKLSHLGGNEGGFKYGVELSSLYYVDESTYLGLVLDYDFCKGKSFIHTGLELASYFGGFQLGPTFVSDEINNKLNGWSFNLYSGALIYPYWGFSYFPSKKLTLPEYGVFVKPFLYPFTNYGRFYVGAH